VATRVAAQKWKGPRYRIPIPTGSDLLTSKITLVAGPDKAIPLPVVRRSWSRTIAISRPVDLGPSRINSIIDQAARGHLPVVVQGGFD